MSLYSKKLHVKKPNNQIQIANLYTDKNDVGSNYLTLNDNNNIVYAPLMNNGDIDCKVNKNNKILKVNSTANIRQNGSATINFRKRNRYDNGTQNYYSQTFTVPDNVHVVNLYFYSFHEKGRGVSYPRQDYSVSANIKVTPNKTYTCQYLTKESVLGGRSTDYELRVKIWFSSLMFETLYYNYQFTSDGHWYHFTDAFVINWYANEPNYQYSAD